MYQGVGTHLVIFVGRAGSCIEGKHGAHTAQALRYYGAGLSICICKVSGHHLLSGAEAWPQRRHLKIAQDVLLPYPQIAVAWKSAVWRRVWGKAIPRMVFARSSFHML